MKNLKASEFPELQRVFSGYLHQDFLEEYDDAGAALRAFLDDANTAENRRFRSEARRLLERVHVLDLRELRALMISLGSCWVPPSRKALIALITDLSSSAE